MAKVTMKKLALLVLLIVSSLTTIINFPITKAQGEHWLSGWSYRKSHVIENATGAGTNYQINLIVHYGGGTDSAQDVYLNSHCRTDFGDVRFTSPDGLTLLDYWIESNVTSDKAVFWISIADDLSSSSATIYIYYGKTEATTTSNGANTFLLFDSFDDDSFNTSMWATYGSPSVTESGGCLNVTTSSVGWVCSNTAFGFNYRIRARAARNIVPGEALVGFCSTDKNDYAFIGDFYGSNNYFFLATKLSGTTNIVNTDLALDSDTAFHVFDVMRISGSSNTGYIDNAHFVNSTFYIPTINLPVGMLAYSSNKVCSTDWIAVTKYVNPEPSQGSWGNEETPPDVTSPTYSNPVTNTTLANQPCQFNVTVNDDVANGYYIFGTNNSGSWINDTAVAFTSTPQTISTIKTLTNHPNYVVEWKYWFNDTSNNWSHTDQYNLTTTAIQRYLTVTSPYGTIGGQGWYDDSSTAYATLDIGIIDQGNGTQRVFTNWSGDATGTSFAQSDPIIMDENKTAAAVWKTQYNVAFTHSGLDSSASGKVVTVNGAQVTYDQLPYSFWADSDSIVTYSYDNVSSTTSGKRFILTGVSGPPSTITVTEPTIVTGTYGTQYEVTIDQTGVETDFTDTVVTVDSIDYNRANLPVSFWWDEDSTHNFSFASPLLVNENKQYEWNATSGLSTLQSGTLTVTASGSIIGNYLVANRITFDQVGVNPDFTSTVLEVDGTPYTANMLPVSFVWEAGSIHTFTYFSPLIVNANAKRYVWTSTSGLSNLQSDTITVTTYGSIVGNYKTQYYLTVTSSYGTPNGGGWYESGNTAYAGLDTGTVDHGNQTRRVFAGWSGDASGTDCVQSNPILMDGPKNAVANWRSQYLLEVATDPVGLTPPPSRDPTGEDGPSGWWYDASTDVTLTAQSITGYNFTNWELDGIPQGDGVNPITLTVNGPYTAKARYAALPAPVHDIAVTKITSTKTVIGQGLSTSINVTVENQGDTSEDFNVTIYANSTQIEKQSVSSLGSEATIILPFTWNTSIFGYGNYTITVSADVVANETDTVDNNLSSYIVLTIRGDINGDFVVDIFDAVRLAGLFNLNAASPKWNPNADINGDGTIDIYDAILLSGNFGKEV